MLARPSFQETGFINWCGFFNPNRLDVIEAVISKLYLMQAHKIADYKDITDLQTALDRMEGKDKDALYQVQKFLGSSQLVRSVFDTMFTLTLAEIIGCDPDLLLIEGPALFVSRPNTDRLLYKWHSEAHYYPKRRKFINIWFPLFGDRTEQNGAMHIKPGSHKEQWDFAEYDSGPNTFVQYEIPAQWVEKYPTHICESRRGDVILFDRNLVHRSAANTSNQYAFACVARAWCPIDDLSLSGSMSATPYGGDIGRAGLMVER